MIASRLTICANLFVKMAIHAAMLAPHADKLRLVELPCATIDRMYAMPVTESTTSLLVKAQLALGLTQRKLGLALGVSARTGHRLGVGRSAPTRRQLARLAVLVYARDPSLASRLAREAATSVEELGLV
jgi:hypothetical protein